MNNVVLLLNENLYNFNISNDLFDKIKNKVDGYNGYIIGDLFFNKIEKISPEMEMYFKLKNISIKFSKIYEGYYVLLVNKYEFFQALIYRTLTLEDGKNLYDILKKYSEREVIRILFDNEEDFMKFNKFCKSYKKD